MVILQEQMKGKFPIGRGWTIKFGHWTIDGQPELIKILICFIEFFN